MQQFDLKLFRKFKNIPQKRLMEIFEVSQSFISDIERGFKPLPKEAYDKLLFTYTTY